MIRRRDCEASTLRSDFRRSVLPVLLSDFRTLREVLDVCDETVDLHELPATVTYLSSVSVY